jgi:peptidoglycan hydrolase-like protein with peptidoglycan-binding domain
MNFYNKLFNGPLAGSVGNSMDNHPDDVRTTKRNLKYAGYFDTDNGEDDPENPILTRALDTRIKRFQADRGLKVDGILKPGGETERSLFETLTRRKADDVFGPPERSDERIGFGGGFGSRMASAMMQPTDDQPRSPFVLHFKNPERENERTSPHLRRVNEEQTGWTPSRPLTTPTQEPESSLGNKKSGYNEKEFLDKVEKTYREYANIGRRNELTNAAENLEHFLEGSGTNKILSREEARDKLFIRNGEETNKKRFKQSFTNKKTSSELLKLKQGQAIEIRDKWDYKVGNFPIKTIIKNTDLSRSHLLRGDLNEAVATGSSFVKSNGDFKATRQGNTIHIDGFVTHRWEDTYDFDPNQSGGAGAVTLEKAGRAKSFDIKSNWQQRVSGTIQIKDGKLINPNLKWEDINSKKEK